MKKRPRQQECSEAFLGVKFMGAGGLEVFAAFKFLDQHLDF